MIRVAVTLRNYNTIQNRIQQLQSTAQTRLVPNVNLNIGLPTLRLLKETIPVWTGEARMNMYMDQRNDYVAIRFPTADPINGHPYIWYTEHGRSAISKNRTSLKGKGNIMRFWTTPHMSISLYYEYKNANKNVVFTPSVGAAKPSNFIGDAVEAMKATAPQIAQ